MSNINHQQTWVTGSRFYFQRDAVAGVDQPIIDMGVMKVVASPNFEISEIDCKDPDGGIQVTIDKAITEIEETYELTFGNLNMDNLSLLFLSGPPEDIGQTAQNQTFKHRGTPGRLLKVLDNNYDDVSAPGDFVQGVSDILGVANGETTSAGGTQPYATVGDAIVSIATSVIKLAAVDRSAELKAGDKIVVCGLDVPGEDGVFTLSIDSTLNVGDTDVTVVEAITDQAGAGNTTVLATTLIEGTDWEEVNLERGFLRMIDGGNLIADADIQVCYSTRAITGARRIKPLTITGLINGKGMIVWGRENNAFQTARIMRVSLIPGTPSFQVEDFSTAVYTATVLTDVTSSEPAGRLDYWLGALPDIS